MALDFNQSIRNKKNTGKSILWFRFFSVVFLVVVCFIFARFIFKGMTLVKNTGADLLAQTIDLTTPKNVLIARQQELQHQNELLQQQLNEKRIHPCHKPTLLYQKLIADYGFEGCKILDTHVGGGSSRIAAKKANCEYVGFEIDPEYWQKQEKRFNTFVSQLTLW
jgi:DNA modification methylase